MIKLLVCDFDGVFTSNHVYVSEDGKESVKCNKADGVGIEMLREQGIETVVLSSEQNPTVVERCKKLDVYCFHAIEDKLSFLEKQLGIWGIDFHEVAFIGNDVADFPCMQRVGLAVCPPDSFPSVVAFCLLNGRVTEKRGGEGCVRELCEFILNGEVVEDICQHERAVELTTMGDSVKKFWCPECGAKYEKPLRRLNV